MDRDLQQYFQELRARGLDPASEERLRREVEYPGRHRLPGVPLPDDELLDPDLLVRGNPPTIYSLFDLPHLQALAAAPTGSGLALRSLDGLIERDKQREADGFPRKIRMGKLVKPGRGPQGRVIVVPTTVEEKFMHDAAVPPEEREESTGGSGEGEEGEVIGEQPVRPEGQGAGPGEGGGDEHELESTAYELGKILTDRFELPNLKDKGKRRSLTRYSYDLTDRNRGYGQLLDKKATLRQVVKTNIGLGRINATDPIDPSELLIAPSDRIYRILSPEQDYESQAVVFFLRDYSASMVGKPTELVVSLHVMIYSWLLYQYGGQVETRFILHDTDAREVDDFYTYYNMQVAGGTKVASAFKLVNEIVEEENLAEDYNIYVFHGTDGDDWDSEGKETIPELKRTLWFANRVGVTVARRGTGTADTTVQKYVKASGLLDEQPELLRLDTLPEDADEERVIEGIKRLID